MTDKTSNERRSDDRALRARLKVEIRAELAATAAARPRRVVNSMRSAQHVAHAMSDIRGQIMDAGQPCEALTHLFAALDCLAVEEAAPGMHCQAVRDTRTHVRHALSQVILGRMVNAWEAVACAAKTPWLASSIGGKS